MRRDTHEMFGHRAWSAVAVAAPTFAAALPACGDAPVGLPATGVGAEAPDFGLEAGPLASRCEPGEWQDAEGRCVPAGIPGDQCGAGFASDGEGCAPHWPENGCIGGLAAPDDDACPTLCSAETFGNAPVDSTTQHVDAAFSGTSDGSVAHPWTKIQDAIDAAAPGAVVAVAAGIYGGAASIVGKPVRLWGACPAEVNVGAIHIQQADGTEVHDLSTLSTGAGVSVEDADRVVLDGVSIHSHAPTALEAQCAMRACRVTVVRSWLTCSGGSVDAPARAAVEVRSGVELRLDSSVVRGGAAVSVVSSLGAARASLSTSRCWIESSDPGGVWAVGSDVVIEDTLIRGNSPPAPESEGRPGVSVAPLDDDDYAPTLVLRRSVIESSHVCGVYAVDSDTTLEATVVRDTYPRVTDAKAGQGVWVVNRRGAAVRPTLRIQSALIERSATAGLQVSGLDATVVGLLVRDTVSTPASGTAGRGISVEPSPEKRAPAEITLVGSVIERSHEVGVAVLGSNALIDSTVGTPNGRVGARCA